jgi:hypothetical protein
MEKTNCVNCDLSDSLSMAEGCGSTFAKPKGKRRDQSGDGGYGGLETDLDSAIQVL